MARASVKKVEYLKAFRFLFEDGNGWKNLLFGSILMIIPIVGPIVLMGWQMITFQNLVRQEERPIPLFDFSNFGDYLGKGVIPFVVSLVIMFPFIFVIIILGFIAGVSVPLFAQQGLPTEFVIVSVVLAVFVIILLGLLPMMVFSTAAVTRAYLTEDFGQAFQIGKIWIFGQAIWKRVAVAYIIFFPISIALMFAGMLAFYIGMYPAMVVMNFAWLFIAWEIYELYLKEGGEPIPLKDASSSPAAQSPRTQTP